MHVVFLNSYKVGFIRIYRDGKSIQNSTCKTLSLKISTKNMCKKCPKLFKVSKNAQNCTKKGQKPLIKRVKKTKISTAVKK